MASLSHTLFFTQPSISKSDALLLALFFAAVVHVFILLSINFTLPDPSKINKSIKITLSHSPSKKAPKKARYLAQNNQQGGDNKPRKLPPQPPKQKLPRQGESKKINPIAEKVRAVNPPKMSDKVITQQQAKETITKVKEVTPLLEKKRPHFSAASLKKQISQLGASIRYSQPSSEKSRIKFVKAVSTHQNIAAQYMLDWEKKIERMGNLNYPEVARKKGFFGTLTMDVGIKPDGSIYSIRITRSSGNKALDNAAKRIVKLSAPFSVLPKELLKELDVLVIPRVWKFSDESGVATR